MMSLPVLIFPSAGLLISIPCFMPPFFLLIMKWPPMAPTSPDPLWTSWTVMNTSKLNLFLTHVSSTPHSTTLCTGSVILHLMTSGSLPPNSLMPLTSLLPSMLLTPLPPLPFPCLIPPLSWSLTIKWGDNFPSFPIVSLPCTIQPCPLPPIPILPPLSLHPPPHLNHPPLHPLSLSLQLPSSPMITSILCS